MIDHYLRRGVLFCTPGVIKLWVKKWLAFLGQRGSGPQIPVGPPNPLSWGRDALLTHTTSTHT